MTDAATAAAASAAAAVAAAAARLVLPPDRLQLLHPNRRPQDNTPSPSSVWQV